jgi:hypothetical protein
MLDEYKTPDSFWVEANAMPPTTSTSTSTWTRLPTKSSPVRSLVCITLGTLGVSVSYLTRNPKPQSLHPRLMKVFSLVMELTNMPIVFSTKPPVCWDHGRREIWWIQRLSTRAS